MIQKMTATTPQSSAALRSVMFTTTTGKKGTIMPKTGKITKTGKTEAGRIVF